MLPEPRVGLAVAAVTGALDIHTAPKLTEHATNLLPNHPHLILACPRPPSATPQGSTTRSGHAAAADGGLALAAVPARPCD
ncbi:hypothetical protein [Streptomyces sp. NPDC090036]|uniref:hypothetical protein n=1 Tax=Streptomyces sp. NPDC090036 TaxID=3365926 RepID=UPI003810F32F